MAREYGQLRHDIWSDDDWRSLTVPAQHLYMMLLSDPSLNYCGVADWRPGKLAQRSAENSGRGVLIAGAELSNTRFLVIDEDTEEVLVRSYLRHDPLMKNPRLAVTMAKDFGTIGSNKIRAVLVYELNRLKREEPDWGAWEKPQVKTVLRQAAVPARDFDPDLPVGAAAYLGVRLGVGLPSATGKGEGSVYQPPTTATATATATGTLSNESAGPGPSSYPQTVRPSLDHVTVEGRVG